LITIKGGITYKINDESIDWEVKRLLDDGIYIDTEQAIQPQKK